MYETGKNLRTNNKKRFGSVALALANQDDIRQSLDSLAGLALLLSVLRRIERRVFDWLLRNYVARQERKHDVLSKFRQNCIPRHNKCLSATAGWQIAGG